MKCAHCFVAFHNNQTTMAYITSDVHGHWGVTCDICPECKLANIVLINGSGYSKTSDGALASIAPLRRSIMIWPKESGRQPCPPEIPTALADDYKEACLVLGDSPKASAALSRRCLQSLLRDAANTTKRDLADQIQEVLDIGHLPSQIAQSIDAIRNIGNFAAHPMKSQHSGEILPVEPGEAEWNLDVLEALFDFYYVQPAILQKKRNALNAKLAEAGKPPMK